MVEHVCRVLLVPEYFVWKGQGFGIESKPTKEWGGWGSWNLLDTLDYTVVQQCKSVYFSIHTTPLVCIEIGVNIS